MFLRQLRLRNLRSIEQNFPLREPILAEFGRTREASYPYAGLNRFLRREWHMP